MPADGYERGYLSVNRQLPGPAIQVCKDDIVVVDVENQMVRIEEIFQSKNIWELFFF